MILNRFRVKLHYAKIYLLAMFFLMLSACGSSESSPTPIVSQGTPVVVSDEATETPSPTSVLSSSSLVVMGVIDSSMYKFDPYLIPATGFEASIVAHIWDTLVWLNEDLELVPGLAESWSLINNLTWEVKIRQDVKFHNGEAIDAEAVRFSVERSQSVPNSLETFASDVNLEQVEIVDKHTVRFHTSEPVANLPYYLTSLEILPPIYYGQDEKQKLLTHPIGSGPYQFEQFSDGSRITLNAVPDYWQGTPKLDNLIFQAVTDSTQGIAELQADRADLIIGLTPDQAINWDSSWGRLETVESTRRIFVGLRVQDGSPLTDKRVREALNYAINVQSISDSLLGGYGQRYGSWVNSPNNNPDLLPWAFDLNKAADLLAEAGYPDGFDIILDTPSGRYHQDEAAAQAIAQQLGLIGINVETRFHDWPTYVDNYLLREDMAPLFLLGLNSRGNGLEDTQNLSVAFPYNLTNWQNPEFEQLLQQAQVTFNQHQRQSLLDRAQTIGYEEVPWIWLWRQYEFYGVDTQLEWKPRRDGLVYLYQPVAN